MNEYLELCEYPLRARATYRVTRQVLDEFAGVGVRSTSDLTPAAIARWIQSRPERSAARANCLLRTLSPAVAYGVDRGYIANNPFAFRKPGRWVRADVGATARPRRSRTPEEIGRVLDRADLEAADGSWVAGRLQALVYLFAFTGIRKMEALTLTVADINLEKGLLTISPKADWRPKTLRSAAVLPIPKPLVDVLRRWISRTGCRWLFPGAKMRGPWTGGMPGANALDQVRMLGERAGVEGLSLLGFRKTIGTAGKAMGVSQLEMKGLLRHSNIDTQRFYDEESPESLRSAVEKIEYPRIRKTS